MPKASSKYPAHIVNGSNQDFIPKEIEWRIAMSGARNMSGYTCAHGSLMEQRILFEAVTHSSSDDSGENTSSNITLLKLTYVSYMAYI